MSSLIQPLSNFDLLLIPRSRLQNDVEHRRLCKDHDLLVFDFSVLETCSVPDWNPHDLLLCDDVPDPASFSHVSAFSLPV